jgi:3-methyl-2-oxobutanoate hydroxymethyltransferase
MTTCRTIEEVRSALAPRRGRRVGLVATMGALHAGHASLFAAARAECDVVAVSIFVNPTQFGDLADLDKYPRDEAGDLARCEAAGVDVVFAPAPGEMYPDGFDTWVDPGAIATILEGAHRPGHFRGVATVCLKLFHIIAPTHAYFGQKDAQQVEVLRRLLRDLDLPLTLRVLPTVRDPDGLALSSRNARLTPADRQRALVLPRALATRDLERARQMLQGVEVDYLEVAPFDPPVLAGAIRVGGVRLIDNVVLDDRPRGAGPGPAQERTEPPRGPAPRPPGKLSLPQLADMKRRRQKIVMVTAYDAPGARLAEQAGLDVLLVGDSAAMVVLGHESTLPITLDEMVLLTRAVVRGAPRTLVVADLPFGTYLVSDEEAVGSAVRLVKEGGADLVKLEGADARLSRVRAVVEAGIPVMGHLGLTPQSATMLGGFRAQGRTAEAARHLVASATALEQAGCCAIVLEAMPPEVASAITGHVTVPTIGIGAGAGCDGQVLVWHDLLGVSDRSPARFVKQYAALGGATRRALEAYAADVRGGAYPETRHTYTMPEDEREAFERHGR